ncbi:MAG: FAD-dependent oxidoreductase [Haloarculaceae archaeon]
MGPATGETQFDYDVVVVGGGPAGCSAAVYTARDDLETVVFDRGSSSLRRCAYLENYLGFPVGIDIETFYDLLHDHAEAAGCDLVADLVETVDRDDGDDNGFVVETQDGTTVTTRYVVAAARYDGEFLRGLDDDDAMFETHDHGGEEHAHFDPDYAESDGQTPVDGLYVASPSGERDVQAIVAAGQGAHVSRTLLSEHRRKEGYPEGILANRYDWVRSDTEFEGEWSERERWQDWFEAQVPADPDTDRDRLDELRERVINRAFDSHRSDEDVAELTEDGHRALAEHLDPDVLADVVDTDRVLERVDDERLRTALDGRDETRDSQNTESNVV